MGMKIEEIKLLFTYDVLQRIQKFVYMKIFMGNSFDILKIS